MDVKAIECFDKLNESLDGLISVYRNLLQIVRKEKSILVSANLDDLNENNKAKEAMLLKIRSLEANRSRHATELAMALGMNMENPRLSDLAVKLSGPQADRLHQIQSVLELLLKRVQEHNKENEVLIHSALENITGAMKAIRNTLQEKTTYQKKGEIAAQPAASGQLVSREA